MDNEEAYFQLGNIYLDLGEPQKAYNYFIGFKRGSNFYEAQFNMAKALTKLGQLRKPSKPIKSHALNPEDPDILINMGVIFSDLGLHLKSINFYEKALEIDPNSFMAYSNLEWSILI